MLLLPNAIENTNPFALTYMSRLFTHTSSPRWGGGYSWKFLVGVCRPVLQILTLFQTTKYHFPHPFSDLVSKIHTPSLWYLNKKPTNPFWVNFLQSTFYFLGFYKQNFFMWMFFMSLLGVERSCKYIFTRPNCRCFLWTSRLKYRYVSVLLQHAFVLYVRYFFECSYLRTRFALRRRWLCTRFVDIFEMEATVLVKKRDFRCCEDLWWLW